jgi:chaperonin GroES
MKFRPLHDRVVIRRIDAEEKPQVVSSSPTPPRRSRQRARSSLSALARNEEGQIVVLEVKPGDRILFGKWSGIEVKLDGEELLIMKESDIMGIIEGKPAIKRKAA